MARLARGIDPLDRKVTCAIERDGQRMFEGQTYTPQIHRSLEESVRYVGRCNSFPEGVWAMAGTSVVPPDAFTLQAGDVVDISFDGLGTLSNPVVELGVDQMLTSGRLEATSRDLMTGAKYARNSSSQQFARNPP